MTFIRDFLLYNDTNRWEEGGKPIPRLQNHIFPHAGAINDTSEIWKLLQNRSDHPNTQGVMEDELVFTEVPKTLEIYGSPDMFYTFVWLHMNCDNHKLSFNVYYLNFGQFSIIPKIQVKGP